MKIQKKITTVIASMLMMILCFTAGNSFAQTKTKAAMTKDHVMMEGGKMMEMKNGKIMRMEKNITMKNGTMVMPTGEYTMKDGKKNRMKDGEYMEMTGKMGKISGMKKGMKGSGMRKGMNGSMMKHN